MRGAAGLQLSQVTRHISFTRILANEVSQPAHSCGTPASESQVVRLITIRSAHDNAGAPTVFRVANGDASSQPTASVSVVASCGAWEGDGGGDGVGVGVGGVGVGGEGTDKICCPPLHEQPHAQLMPCASSSTNQSQQTFVRRAGVATFTEQYASSECVWG